MGKPKVTAAGGFPAILYTLKKAVESGSFAGFMSKMFSKNACKTCALGMGGQKGGMVNEAGHFPEFCKKSVQAQAGDMGGIITEDFFKSVSLAQLARFSSRELEHLGRLTFPVIATEEDTHYRRISWDEAFEIAGSAFRNTSPDRTFFYSSGRASNEAAFLMQLVARAYGTNNVNNCSYYCHQASGVALNKVYGSGTASIVLDDLEKADLALVIGANPASNHPRLITQLANLRKRGGKVIVINPLKELGLVRFKIPSKPLSLLFGSKISDLYLQPKAGEDIALLKAILKSLIERNYLATEFIAENTLGWDDVKRNIEATSWEVLTARAGLPKARIEEAAKIIAQAKRGIFMWAMGLTHHKHGVDNILALANLALSQGWLGHPGTGLLPIRGHSNVQGVGTVGVAPALKEAFALKLEEMFEMKLPTAAGLDTYASMVAAAAGQIDAAFLLGGNLYGSNPDLAWAGRALRNIPLTVTVSTKLNTGHAMYGAREETSAFSQDGSPGNGSHGDGSYGDKSEEDGASGYGLHRRIGATSLILPALARDEESQGTTQESMFNYVRLSEGGNPNVAGEMRSEVEIIAELARRVLPDKEFDWEALRSHATLREKMAEAIPALAPLKELNASGQEFQMPGRTFHTPVFETEDGKARFHVVSLPEATASDGEFTLMTLRSEGQFNTVVYEDEDLYRGNRHRNVVMLSAEDARYLQIAEGDEVTVATESGQMTVEAAIVDIAPGSLAMYYPEANVLVPQRLDPQSQTPAFKSVRARLLTTHGS